MKSHRTQKPKTFLQQPASDSESAGGVSKMPVQRDSPVEFDRETPEKFRSSTLNMRAELSQSTPVLQGFFSSYFDKLGWGGVSTGVGSSSSGNIKGELDYTHADAGRSKIESSSYKLTDSTIGHKDAFSNDHKDSGYNNSKISGNFGSKEDDGLLKF